MSGISKIKEIRFGDKHFNNLYFHEVPLNKLFAKVEPWESGKKPAKEYYLSMKCEAGRSSHCVTVTDEFESWIQKNMLVDYHVHFEIIQQIKYNKNRPNKYLDSWLVTASYSSILGSTWLDYKTGEEIQEIFH